MILFHKGMLKKEMKQWKNLMNHIPLSIIIQHKSQIEFSNKAAKLLIKPEKSNNRLITNRDILDEEYGAENIYEDYSNLTKFISNKGDITLHELIFEESSLNIIEGTIKFTKSSNNNFHYYEVNSTKSIFFNLKICRAFFIKDITSSEKLKETENKEKNTRIYIASVTHDLRTPINGIVGMMECIKKYTQDPFIIDCISIANNSSEILLLLIRDILDITQLESNAVRLNYEKVNIVETIKETAKMFEKDLMIKNLYLSLNFSKSSIDCIWTDKMRYRQIITNLISNALKYTLKGGITVKIKYSFSSNILKTAVKDTGVGIKKEDQDKLFNLFGKLNNNSQMNPNGVGLGLTICKKLSQLLGGDIILKSVPGKGSIFKFTVLNDSSRNNLKSVSEQQISGSLTFPENLSSGNFLYQFPLTCSCPKLLFVDDNSTNIIVLKGYISGTSLDAEIVI